MNQTLLLKITGRVGLLGACIVWLWEFLLHFSPTITEASGAFSFFLSVPFHNLVRGHRIAIIWVPLYYVWYYHFYQIMKPASRNWASVLFGLGVIAFTIGGMRIASRWFIGSIVQLQSSIPSDTYTDIISNYTLFWESLVQVLRVTIVFISILWIWLVGTWKTIYKKRIMILNPLVLLISVFVLYAILPEVWKYLAPIAMNVVHVVLFWVSLGYVYSTSDGEFESFS